MQASNLLRLAALSGFLAVAIGAFGAHGLKPQLTEHQLAIFEKGVQYQFFHTLAALFSAWLFGQGGGQNRRFGWAARLFLAGIALFSGSLFLLACRDLLGFSVGWAGPVTPFGGLCFLAGWACLFLGFGGQRQGA